MKNSLIILVVAVVAAVTGFAIYRQTHSAATSSASSQPVPAESVPAAAASKPMPTTIPDVSLPNREGNKQSLRSWPGKSMIINFWATWCAPCRKEIPLLKEINKAEAQAGFQVVGVAIDYRDDVLKYAENIKMDYPILIGEQDGLAVGEAFGVDAAGLPFTVFTDQQGRIVSILMGELTREKADAILSNVKRVNQGELTPEAARAAIAQKLQGMKAA